MINLVLKCKIASMLLLDAPLQPLGCGYNRTSKFSQCFYSEKEQLCGLTGSHLWSAAVVTVEPVHIRIKKKNKPKKAICPPDETMLSIISFMTLSVCAIMSVLQE